MKLLIVGAGGHGKCCYEIAMRMNQFEKIDFVDDNAVSVLGKEVVGTSKDLCKFHEVYDCVFVAIGNNEVRMSKLDELKKIGYKIATLIDPLACISKYSEIKEGSVVFPFVSIEPETVIEEGSVICSNTTIHHNVQIKKGSLIYSNCVIRPEIEVAINSRIESGTTIRKG